MPKFIDLSRAIENDVPADPPGYGPRVEYIAHQQSAPDVCAFFPGLSPQDLPDSEGWALEWVRLMTHNGTHLDAPWHYASVMNGDQPASTIDEIPLEWCYGPGVKLDFRAVPDGIVLGAAAVEAELARIGHRLRPGDIVLANTAAGARYGEAGYVHAGCGFGREATLWLTEQGVRVVGTDAWSWDAPFSHTARRWAETQDPKIIWEGHKAGRERAYCQIEKLGHLESLPPFGFTVMCFPVKIHRASAGWCRAVAMLAD